MGDRLVTWSGGGRFNAKKDVASAAIVPVSGGKILRWTVGGTPVSFQSTAADLSYQKTTQNLTTASWTRANYTLPNNSAGVLYVFDWQLTSINTSQQNSDGIIGRWRRLSNSVGVINQCSISAYPLGTPQTLLNVKKGTTPSFTPVGNCTPYSATWGLKITDSNGLITNFSYQSEPTGFSTETVQAGCKIVVTYTDNSTFDIPLTTCPDWVRTGTANSCPEGTIRQCIHGTTTCCYGCVNGRLTLIDSFNKV